MSYTIRITSTRTVDRRTKEYQRVAETGNPMDNKAQFDYVEVTKPVDETVNILEQTVETLDIAAVIRAINNL